MPTDDTIIFRLDNNIPDVIANVADFSVQNILSTRADYNFSVYGKCEIHPELFEMLNSVKPTEKCDIVLKGKTLVEVQAKKHKKKRINKKWLKKYGYKNVLATIKYHMKEIEITRDENQYTFYSDKIEIIGD